MKKLLLALTLLLSLRAADNRPDYVTQIKNKPILDPREYAFVPIAPGGSLVSGNNTVTLPLVPKGINGTDTNHRLWVSGGVGTAEACLIAGGTGVAGQTNGQLIINCANTHSGGWTVSSVAGGLPETINAAPTGAVVLVTSAITARATTAINTPTIIQCGAGITITWAGSSTAVFSIAANNTVIQDCVIAAGSASTAITNSGVRTGLKILGNQITGASNPLLIDAGSDLEVAGNHISGFVSCGMLIGNHATATDQSCGVVTNTLRVSNVRIHNNYVDSSGSTTMNGGAIIVWSNHSTITGNNVIIGGNQDQGILVLDDPGAGINNATIADNTVFVNGANAFECIGVASIDTFVITGNTCKVNVTLTGAGFIAFEANRSSNGVLTANTFYGATPTAPTNGIFMESTQSVVARGNNIYGWGAHILSAGILLEHTGTNPIGNTMSDNIIAGNVVIQTAATATSPEIRVETLVAGTISNNLIEGNQVTGTTQAGHICIYATNSALTTFTKLRIANNAVDTCDTGIQLTSGTSQSIENNRITGATTLLADSATTTKIIDTNGVPFSFLSSQANSSWLYVSNSNSSCTGTGNGQFCKRLNGAWTN